MSIRSAMAEAAMYADLFSVAMAAGKYTDASYKGSSTKKGNSPKTIKARRKKNKNKKTHRK